MNKPIMNQLPGEKESLAATMRNVFRLHDANLNKLLPAQVVNYDRTKNLATVQPMIMFVDTNDQQHMRGQVANVPVVSLGGGGFTINFPLQNGDFGWLLAADRDVSQFLQNMKASAPNTLRTHSFSDSWFIPDVFRQYTINSADANAMVIQSLDGTTRISIRAGEIDITAPTTVKVTTPNAVFSQNVQITGLLSANGGFNATGGGNQPCTLPQDTTINGINVANHGHNGVQSGSSRTGGGMVT